MAKAPKIDPLEQARILSEALPHMHGILRLRSGFAARGRYFAQDDIC